jgi:hypothetical protein
MYIYIFILLFLEIERDFQKRTIQHSYIAIFNKWENYKPNTIEYVLSLL